MHLKPKERAAGESLSGRIRRDLEANIRTGVWPPGHRLPIEEALRAEYGCARMTVSKAVAGLAEAGLVERRRKAGTFVTRPRVQTALLEIPDLAVVIANRGQAYGYEMIQRTFRRPSADPEEAALGAPGDVLAVEGLHYAAERPFALEHRIICTAAAPEALSADFTRQAPGSWLLTHVPWSDARHRISAVAADAKTARRLHIPKGHACLRLERWTWRAGQGVTFARQTYPGDAYDLIADFAAGLTGTGHG